MKSDTTKSEHDEIREEDSEYTNASPEEKKIAEELNGLYEEAMKGEYTEATRLFEDEITKFGIEAITEGLVDKAVSWGHRLDLLFTEQGTLIFMAETREDFIHWALAIRPSQYTTDYSTRNLIKGSKATLFKVHKPNKYYPYILHHVLEKEKSVQEEIITVPCISWLAVEFTLDQLGEWITEKTKGDTRTMLLGALETEKLAMKIANLQIKIKQIATGEWEFPYVGCGLRDLQHGHRVVEKYE
jgi:hypothetical protein